MIYTIEHTSKRWFICGFFSREDEAKAHLIRIVQEPQCNINDYKLVKTFVESYPIYVLTSPNGYIYTNSLPHIKEMFEKHSK